MQIQQQITKIIKMHVKYKKLAEVGPYQTTSEAVQSSPTNLVKIKGNCGHNAALLRRKQYSSSITKLHKNTLTVNKLD